MNKQLIQKHRHIRFYCTLLMKDMLLDAPLETLSHFYGLSQMELKGFQQKCTIYSSTVVQLCKHLKWWNLYNLLLQSVDRINFVIQEELEELVNELDSLDPAKARAIYEAGYSSVYLISKARPLDILKAVQKSMSMHRQYS